MYIPDLSIYEAVMLICFGISWPFALYKTYTTKSAEGKSLRFSFFVIIGYFAGIVHKILYSFDIVILLYIANLLMVLADILMCIKYRHFSKKPT